MGRENPDGGYWDRAAPHYDRVVTGVFGKPWPRVLALTADAVAGAGTVLEVAAGTGLITVAIAPRVRRMIATDASDAMLVRLRARVGGAGLTNVEVIRRDLYALNFPSSSFDVVVAGNVLHLVPDLDAAIDALRRVLRPGGKLITPTYLHGETVLARIVSGLLVRVLEQPMERRLTLASLRRALEQRGLRVVRAEIVPGVIPIGYVESEAT